MPHLSNHLLNVINILICVMTLAILWTWSWRAGKQAKANADARNLASQVIIDRAATEASALRSAADELSLQLRRDALGVAERLQIQTETAMARMQGDADVVHRQLAQQTSDLIGSINGAVLAMQKQNDLAASDVKQNSLNAAQMITDALNAVKAAAEKAYSEANHVNLKIEAINQRVLDLQSKK